MGSILVRTTLTAEGQVVGDDGFAEVYAAHRDHLVRPALLLPTRHGIVEGVGRGLTIRLLPEAGGEALSAVELPAELGSVPRARLSTIGGDPVVLVGGSGGEAVIAPTADGTLEVTVLPTQQWTTGATDWVD